jgi:glycosyltransferase involved in cell wall biosynthesis
MSTLRIGYVVKRFPRVSETFIAQEILQLEQLGAAVHVFALIENDRPAGHAWLSQIRANVTRIEPLPFSEVWTELSRRARTDSNQRRAVREVVNLALEHPFGKGRRYLGGALALSDAASDLQLHHLHAHFANRPAWVTRSAAALCNLPFSFTAHAKDIYRDTVDSGYWQALLRRCAFAVTVSKANVAYLEELAGPVATAKLRLLYNGVDIENIRPRQQPAQPAKFQIACVARLVEKKGVDTLLDAVKSLVDGGTDVECAIAGDGPLAVALHEHAERLDLGRRVRFLGALPHESVLALVRKSDVVVLPCRVTADGDRDALPTVLLEALAAGVPCISTPVGGVPEIVQQDQNGMLVEPDDSTALAQAIARLAGDNALQVRYALESRSCAERLFDRRRNVATLFQWMRESARSFEASSAAPGLFEHSEVRQDANRVRLL